MRQAVAAEGGADALRSLKRLSVSGDVSHWEPERDYLLGRIKDLTGFDGRPWVAGPPLSKRRIAIITISGIHRFTCELQGVNVPDGFPYGVLIRGHHNIRGSNSATLPED